MDPKIEGRMLVLEVMAMSSLGLYLANAVNDPDMGKARAMLDYIRQMVSSRCAEVGVDPDAAYEAGHYADDLLSQALENLRLLRGGG